MAVLLFCRFDIVDYVKSLIEIINNEIGNRNTWLTLLAFWCAVQTLCMKLEIAIVYTDDMGVAMNTNCIQHFYKHSILAVN